MSDLVRAGVGSRATILEVSEPFLGARTRNTNRSTTVSDTSGESVNGTGLVAASQAHSVVVTVDSNVLLVAFGELLNGLVDVVHTARRTHLLGGNVGVETRAVPVTPNIC